MSVDLRPLNVGEILDRTVQVYRTRFWLFVGVAAPPAVVVLACFAAGFLLAQVAGKGGTANSVAAGVGFGVLFLIGMPLYVGVTALGYAALSAAAQKRYFDEAVTVREAYKEAWAHLWRYVGLFAMELLAAGVAPFAVMVAGIIGAGVVVAATGASKDASGLIIGFTMLGLVAVLGVYVLWLLPRLCLAFPACVVEQAGAWKSLKRGWTLSQGTRWRVLLLFVLGGAMGWMASWIITIPAFVVIALMPSLHGPQHAQAAGQVMIFVTYGASFAVQAFIRPVYGAGLMVFYYDQRIRKEGFDIEHMMQAAGWGELAAGASTEGAIPQAEGQQA